MVRDTKLKDLIPKEYIRELSVYWVTRDEGTKIMSNFIGSITKTVMNDYILVQYRAISLIHIIGEKERLDT